jgi:hypothetical protein
MAMRSAASLEDYAAPARVYFFGSGFARTRATVGID